jgi:hypothetical protein
MRSGSASDAMSTRRSFLGASVAALPWAVSRRAIEKKLSFDRAQIANTLDLEMSRHFPTWDQTHWDYGWHSIRRGSEKSSDISPQA